MKAMAEKSVAHCKQQILDNKEYRVIIGISQLLKLPASLYQED